MAKNDAVVAAILSGRIDITDAETIGDEMQLKEEFVQSNPELAQEIEQEMVDAEDPFGLTEIDPEFEPNYEGFSEGLFAF